MKRSALAVAILVSGTWAASAQVNIEVPGVRVGPPRVEIERRDKPVREERRKIEVEGRAARWLREQERHEERARRDEDRYQRELR